ncbi:hypothetical protein T492DRAFT_42813 [Pavlovales sp. CCMP2436]|nr:hypothetical protein T492DRAFT_42813 [Pavlovales sp. CCMP2436]
MSQTITRTAKGVLLELEFPVRHNTARSATLLWLSPEGVEREYATFPSGAEGQVVHTQATFEWDVWRVREAGSGRLLLEHTATRAETQRLTIREAAQPRHSSSPQPPRASTNEAAQPNAGGSDAVEGDAEAEEEAQLQRALALSLAEQQPAGQPRQRSQPPSQTPGLPQTTPGLPQISGRSPGQSEQPGMPVGAQLAVSLEEAMALSAQLAAQRDAVRSARAQLAAKTSSADSAEGGLSSAGGKQGRDLGGGEAEARLQCRFADLDGSRLELRVRAGESIQPVIDAVLSYIDSVAALSVSADSTGPADTGTGEAAQGSTARAASAAKVRVKSAHPSLNLVFTRSGLVLSSQPMGAHLRTANELGLLPSAVLHVTVDL